MIPKTAMDYERMRKADAIIQEKLKKAFVPEPVEFEDKCFFVVSRCVKGPQGWKGVLRVEEVITSDNGKTLKRPIRKTVADGVDIVIAMSNLETALRKRIFK